MAPQELSSSMRENENSFENLTSAQVQAISARINAILAKSKGLTSSPKPPKLLNLTSPSTTTSTPKSSKTLHISLNAKTLSSLKSKLSNSFSPKVNSISNSPSHRHSTVEHNPLTVDLSVANSSLKNHKEAQETLPYSSAISKIPPDGSSETRSNNEILVTSLPKTNSKNISAFNISDKSIQLTRESNKITDALFTDFKIVPLEIITNGPNPQSIANEVMEFAVIQEVTNAFLGIQGIYLKWSETSSTNRIFEIAKDLEPSLFHFISIIIPCICNLESLKRCCSFATSLTTEWKGRGRIAFSLFCSISKIIDRFHAELALFEKDFWGGQSSMLKLWIKIEPFSQFFSELVKFCKEILSSATFVGGNLINYLYEKSLTLRGDIFMSESLNSLLEDVTFTYNSIVVEAIQTGTWHDLIGEFCVIAKAHFNPIIDEDKCTLATAKGNIPYYLVDFQKKIYEICKYNEIFKKCSVAFTLDIFSLSSDRNSLLTFINSVHFQSSKRLFEFFVKEKQMFSCLGIISDFFFMQKIDFFQSLFSQLDPWLSHKAKSVSISKIYSTFESLLEDNTHAKNLKIFFHSKIYISQLLSIINIATDMPTNAEFDDDALKICDAITLDFVSEYPLSIVFGKNVIVKYQLLFRHLLFLFSVHYRLPKVMSKLSPFLTLQLNHFLRNMRSFFISDIIASSWSTFIAKAMNSCTSLHEFNALHEDFLDNCLKDCMLTEPKLLRLYSRVLHSCLECMNTAGKGENFLIAFKVFVDALYFEAATDSNRHLNNLLYKIDYNNFYANKFVQ